MTLIESSIVRTVIGHAIDVHRVLGPGLLEAAYTQCLAYQLSSAGLNVAMQVPLPVRYRDVKIDCGFRIDLLVERQLIVEVKSVERLHPIHQAQAITYLKLSGLPQALIINFNVTLLRTGIKSVLPGRQDFTLDHMVAEMEASSTPTDPIEPG